MRKQPEHAVRRAAPLQNGVESRRSVARPSLIHIRAAREQRVEHRDIPGARGEGQGDAVVRIGAGVEQDSDEGQRLCDARCAPEHRAAHAVMHPRESGIRICAEGDQPLGDRGEALTAHRRPLRHGCVADVMDRLPAPPTRSADLRGH